MRAPALPRMSAKRPNGSEAAEQGHEGASIILVCVVYLARRCQR